MSYISQLPICSEARADAGPAWNRGFSATKHFLVTPFLQHCRGAGVLIIDTSQAVWHAPHPARRVQAMACACGGRIPSPGELQMRGAEAVVSSFHSVMRREEVITRMSLRMADK